MVRVQREVLLAQMGAGHSDCGTSVTMQDVLSLLQCREPRTFDQSTNCLLFNRLVYSRDLPAEFVCLLAWNFLKLSALVFVLELEPALLPHRAINTRSISFISTMLLHLLEMPDGSLEKGRAATILLRQRERMPRIL